MNKSLTGARECPCGPICDFCRFYNFNGDGNGVYTGEGRCEHPDHPRPEEPFSACEDYECEVCGRTAA